MLANELVWVRGAGELGSGVAHLLHRVGLHVFMSDLAPPLAIRRPVTFSCALVDGSTVVEGVEEDETKTLSSTREVFLLPPALDALNAQKAHTFLTGKRIFHDSLTNEPWIWPWQIRERWISVLRQAKVRYRNPYQTRHTYASTLLSNGENMMWVSKQLGHVNTEMVMRTYGRWIPDHSSIAGYQTKNDWSVYLSGVESTAKNEKVG